MLTVSQLSKSFAGRALFDDVSLQVPAKGTGLYRFYLQLITDFWGRILVRRMASTIEGGCLCGGVRYRLHVRPKQGSDCHCEDCRRASAAPYVTWCSVPSKAIELLSGELRRVSYADRLRSFASCCGTPLFFQDEVSSEWIDVTVASLDDPKTFHPEVAIWTEDKLPWVKLAPSRRAFRRGRDENA